MGEKAIRKKLKDEMKTSLSINRSRTIDAEEKAGMKAMKYERIQWIEAIERKPEKLECGLAQAGPGRVGGKWSVDDVR